MVKTKSPLSARRSDDDSSIAPCSADAMLPQMNSRLTRIKTSDASLFRGLEKRTPKIPNRPPVTPRIEVAETRRTPGTPLPVDSEISAPTFPIVESDPNHFSSFLFRHALFYPFGKRMEPMPRKHARQAGRRKQQNGARGKHWKTRGKPDRKPIKRGDREQLPTPPFANSQPAGSNQRGSSHNTSKKPDNRSRGSSHKSKSWVLVVGN